MLLLTLAIGLILIADSAVPTGALVRTTTANPHGLICRKCVNAKTLFDCTSYERCSGSNFDCYMDQVITDSSQIVYNGGCRAKDICQSSASSINSGLGKKRDMSVCSRCCNADKCNTHLCSIPDGQASTNPSCYSCDHRSQNSEQNEVRNPADCVTMSTCQSNEVCMSSTTVVAGKAEFFFGCYSAAICKVLMNQTFEDLQKCDPTNPNNPTDLKQYCGEVEKTRAVGQVNVCHACCGDTGCNYEDCRVLREKMYAFYKNGLLDFNTLKIRVSG